MSVLQWVLLGFCIPIFMFYIGVVVVFTHVSAAMMQKPVREVPLGHHPWRVLVSAGLLLILVLGIIPLGEMAYDWAFVTDELTGVIEVANLDESSWWYVVFDGAVACEGDLRLASSISWSDPSPDCDGTPRLHLRFPFGENLRLGTAIVNVQIQPGGAIHGMQGGDVDLAFDYVRLGDR